MALAVLLAGGLWLTLRPPRWLRPDRHARRFGVGMALTLVIGFVLVSRLGLHGVDLADAGMMSYLLFATPLVVLVGSAAAAAAGRSLRAGLWPAPGPPCWARRWSSSPGWPRRRAGTGRSAGCSWTPTEGLSAGGRMVIDTDRTDVPMMGL